MIDLAHPCSYLKECREDECDCAQLNSDDLKGIIIRLRQAEKDAARYRWLMENCGMILEPARNRTHLYIPNYCPLSMDYVGVSNHIDEVMQCK